MDKQDGYTIWEAAQLARDGGMVKHPDSVDRDGYTCHQSEEPGRVCVKLVGRFRGFVVLQSKGWLYRKAGSDTWQGKPLPVKPEWDYYKCLAWLTAKEGRVLIDENGDKWSFRQGVFLRGNEPSNPFYETRKPCVPAEGKPW